MDETPKKKPDPKPAINRQPCKIRWVAGGPFADGEFDASSGLVYCRRNGKDVVISVHSGVIHWVETI